MSADPASFDSIEVALARAFAPMHKRVLGVAVGLTAALALFLMTAFHVVTHPPDGPPLELLAQYFHGYEVTWRGAVIGAAWAFLVGFVGGWFAAFLRNVTMALWLMVVRVRANLSETRDFLDHI